MSVLQQLLVCGEHGHVGPKLGLHGAGNVEGLVYGDGEQGKFELGLEE